MVHCIESGTPLLIESLPEEIDAALEPVVARRVIRRGRHRVLRLGAAEVRYDPGSGCTSTPSWPAPHYGPEVAAQTTLVNFCDHGAGAGGPAVRW